MVSKTFCDICGEEIEDREDFDDLLETMTKEILEDSSGDLCNRCQNDVNKYCKNKKKEFEKRGK